RPNAEISPTRFRRSIHDDGMPAARFAYESPALKPLNARPHLLIPFSNSTDGPIDPCPAIRQRRADHAGPSFCSRHLLPFALRLTLRARAWDLGNIRMPVVASEARRSLAFTSLQKIPVILIILERKIPRWKC